MQSFDDISICNLIYYTWQVRKFGCLIVLSCLNCLTYPSDLEQKITVTSFPE